MFQKLYYLSRVDLPEPEFFTFYVPKDDHAPPLPVVKGSGDAPEPTEHNDKRLLLTRAFAIFICVFGICVLEVRELRSSFVPSTEMSFPLNWIFGLYSFFPQITLQRRDWKNDR